MERIPDQDETAALCALAKAGDQAARQLAEEGGTRSQRRRLERAVTEGRQAEAALVNGHSRLINYLCARVIQSIGLTDVPYDDLYQEACIGFIFAVRNYDPTQGSLSNYATWRVRDQIQAFVRGNNGLSGKTAGTLLVSLRRYIPLLEERLGRQPTPAELTELYNETTLLRYQSIAASKPGGEDLGGEQLREEGIRQMKRRGVWLTVERVEALLRRQQSQISLDAPVYRDEQDSDVEADFLAGEEDVAEAATDAVAYEELAAQVARALQRLAEEHGPDAARVVALRFGLGGEGPLSIVEITAATGLAGTRVRKLLNTGLAELRDLLGGLDLP